MYWGDRPAMEVTAAMILQNLFGRYPNVHVCLSEMGTVWLPYLLRKMDHAFLMGRKAKWAENGRLDRRPTQIFREHFIVAPYPEENVPASCSRCPESNRIVFGSDFPHGEGLAYPGQYADAQLKELDDGDVRAIMRGNLARFLGIPARRPMEVTMSDTAPPSSGPTPAIRTSSAEGLSGTRSCPTRSPTACPAARRTSDSEEIVHVDGQSFRRPLPKHLHEEGRRERARRSAELVNRAPGAGDIDVTDAGPRPRGHLGGGRSTTHSDCGRTLITDRSSSGPRSRAPRTSGRSARSSARGRQSPRADGDRSRCSTSSCAVEELHHAASLGLHAVSLPTGVPEGVADYNRDSWEPLWAAAEEAGMVLGFHIGSDNDGNGNTLVFRGPGRGGAQLRRDHLRRAVRPRRSWSLGGALDRHPNLKVLISEGGATWVPFIGDRMNEGYRQHAMFVRPALSAPPKEILYRQVYTSFQHDESAPAALWAMGYHNVMWGSDYPHLEGTFGHTQKTLHELFDDVDARGERPHPARRLQGALPPRERPAGLSHRRGSPGSSAYGADEGRPVTRPLAGLRVVDCSLGTAGPQATGLLADYGADVTWVEPPGGDPARGWFPAAASVFNRGKRSVVLDLEDPGGRARVLELADRADVLVESWAPGVASSFDLGYDTVHARNPSLVYTSISAFGPDGPHRDLPAYEPLVHALVGTMAQQPGHRDGPIFQGLPFATTGAAHLAVLGTLAALSRRLDDGVGRHVETSLLDGALAYLSMLWGESDAGMAAAGAVDMRAMTGASRMRLVTRSFVCSDDEYLGIHTGAVGAFGRLMQVLGLDDRIPPSESGIDMGVPLTPEQAELLEREIHGIFASRPRAFWVARLMEADVCAVEHLHPTSVFDEPQPRHNAMVVRVDDPALGPVEQVAPAIRFDGVAPGDPQPAPAPGQHTELVLDSLARPADDSPWRVMSAEPGQPDERPLLAGVHIVDLGAYYAGPYSSRLLADLGADVIKLEPTAGDPLRGIERPFFSAQAGKRSLAANLKDPGLAPAIDKLLDWADVVHHNMRPGAAERLGLGAEQVRAAHPDVIYLYAPGWGSSGPHMMRQSFAPMLSGYVGASYEVAGRYNEPMPSTGNEDPGNGLLGAIAILTALLHRRRTGHAAVVREPAGERGDGDDGARGAHGDRGRCGRDRRRGAARSAAVRDRALRAPLRDRRRVGVRRRPRRSRDRRARHRHRGRERTRVSRGRRGRRPPPRCVRDTTDVGVGGRAHRGRRGGGRARRPEHAPVHDRRRAAADRSRRRGRASRARHRARARGVAQGERRRCPAAPARAVVGRALRRDPALARRQARRDRRAARPRRRAVARVHPETRRHVPDLQRRRSRRRTAARVERGVCRPGSATEPHT